MRHLLQSTCSHRSLDLSSNRLWAYTGESFILHLASKHLSPATQRTTLLECNQNRCVQKMVLSIIFSVFVCRVEAPLYQCFIRMYLYVFETKVVFVCLGMSVCIAMYLVCIMYVSSVSSIRVVFGQYWYVPGNCRSLGENPWEKAPGCCMYFFIM